MHHLHREAAAQLLRGRGVAEQQAQRAFIGWMFQLEKQLQSMRQKLSTSTGTATGTDKQQLLQRATATPTAGERACLGARSF